MEKIDTKNKYKLKRFINQLKAIKGRHTELVTIYVPKGYNLLKVTQQLAQEKDTAKNIKDKRTRTNVEDSLERLIRHLRLYKNTPENGLAAFAGNISTNESKINIEVFSIEPPVPLTTRLYRCDQTFVLDELEKQLDSNVLYGLIVMDKREGTIGLLKGSYIEKLHSLTSGVPGKYKTGGQCCLPETQVEINKSFKKIKHIELGDLVKSFDFKNKKFIFSECVDKWNVKKDYSIKIKTEGDLINESSKDHVFFTIKGEKPAEKLTTEDFLFAPEGDKLKPVKILKIETINKPTEMVDISVKNQNFIANGLIVHNSAARFSRLREQAAKEFYLRIADIANKEFLNKPEIKGIIIGGPGPTKHEFFDGSFLNNEVKKKVLGLKDITYTDEFGLESLVEISKDLLAEEDVTSEKEALNKFFSMLATEPKRTAYGLKDVEKALDFGAVEILLILEDGIDDKKAEALEEKAMNMGAETEIVTDDTQEGKQFKNLGGVGAVLRFPIH
jgi:peptide subunit release factor 1 (eRF1)